LMLVIYCVFILAGGSLFTAAGTCTQMMQMCRKSQTKRNFVMIIKQWQLRHTGH